MKINEHQIIVEILTDKTLSSKAKTIFGLLILQKGELLNTADIAKAMKEGGCAITTGIKELREVNLITSEVLRSSNRIEKCYFEVNLQRWNGQL